MNTFKYFLIIILLTITRSHTTKLKTDINDDQHKKLNEKVQALISFFSESPVEPPTVLIPSEVLKSELSNYINDDQNKKLNKKVSNLIIFFINNVVQSPTDLIPSEVLNKLQTDINDLFEFVYQMLYTDDPKWMENFITKFLTNIHSCINKTIEKYKTIIKTNCCLTSQKEDINKLMNNSTNEIKIYVEDFLEELEDFMEELEAFLESENMLN
uniref:Uncharacterized protein n=1 Tax=Metapenaeus joyneri majanivirus TaxID=2984280 RepID=A0A9C7F724_9VIRU|nr:MAG: hypothetical protein [Metapenaeus joyneri majanivirus]